MNNNDPPSVNFPNPESSNEIFDVEVGDNSIADQTNEICSNALSEIMSQAIPSILDDENLKNDCDMDPVIDNDASNGNDAPEYDDEEADEPEADDDDDKSYVPPIKIEKFDRDSSSGITPSKRVRQKTVIFSPDVFVKPIEQVKPDGTVKKDGRGRKKKIIADGDSKQAVEVPPAKQQHNKWKAYKDKINVLLRTWSREAHSLNVYRQDAYETKAIQQCEDKVTRVKEEIYETFERIAAENANDKVWSVLADDGKNTTVGVNVEEIYCSRCNLDVIEGEENNDILLCDKQGCCRAYHQKCLEPPFVFGDKQSITDDWFCWQCECLDECLGFVNEVMELDFTDWKLLFPELRESDLDEVT